MKNNRTDVSGFGVACPCSVLQRVEARLGCSRSESLALWSELLRFLKLCAQTELPLAPSTIVDEMWHDTILHTRDYASICEAVCGRFVHHVPATYVDHDAYRHTLRKLNDTFGVADPKYWPVAGEGTASCSRGCGSDCKGEKGTDLFLRPSGASSAPVLDANAQKS